MAAYRSVLPAAVQPIPLWRLQLVVSPNPSIKFWCKTEADANALATSLRAIINAYVPSTNVTTTVEWKGP